MSCIAVVATVQPAESSFEAASGGSSPAIPQHAASNHLFNK